MDLSINITTPVVNFYQTDLSPVLDRIDALETLIKTQGATEMAAMDDLEAKLTDAETRGDAVSVLLATIHQELVDMIASGATPARLQAMADRLDSDSARWQEAADANPDPNAAPPPAP